MPTLAYMLCDMPCLRQLLKDSLSEPSSPDEIAAVLRSKVRCTHCMLMHSPSLVCFRAAWRINQVIWAGSGLRQSSPPTWLTAATLFTFSPPVPL